MTSPPPATPPTQKPLYRYGRMAWVWQLVIASALLLAALLLWLGSRDVSLTLWLMAITIATPALFFGLVVVTAIDDNMDGTLTVNSLLPWRRRVPRANISAPRLRTHYEGEVHRMYAPAMWVRVGQWLPLYIDLLGTITDRREFALAFHMRGSELPGGGGHSRG